ncbi:MAG TPA: YceI family protein [Gemmatimonadales bacterium]|nr:YceI family protein [Gemmatimonadales bacterium]
MGRNALLAALAVTLAAPAAALGQAVPEPASSTAATKWVVDPVHSQVDFRIRHLVGRVRGTFTDWYGLLETQNRDWTHGTVRVTVQTRSLDTGNKYRDADLRSSRFFAVDSFPQMTFESTRIIARGSSVELRGVLTIKGRSRPIVLKGAYRGIARDREGHERIGFEASTTIDRRDYGITWNEVVAGVSTIGNDVDITITIEAARIT